jgi:hypothetical protein
LFCIFHLPIPFKNFLFVIIVADRKETMRFSSCQ